MVEYETVVLFVATILQLGAAYYAYRLMKTSGRFFAWTLITAMLILMVVRRFVVFLGPDLPVDSELIDMVGATITLLISVAAFAGMYKLMKIFRD